MLTHQPFVCSQQQLALTMCLGESVSSGGQNLTTQTKQPFHWSTECQCSVKFQKQSFNGRISMQWCNITRSVSQVDIHFCSAWCLLYQQAVSQSRRSRLLDWHCPRHYMAVILCWSAALQYWHIGTIDYVHGLSCHHQATWAETVAEWHFKTWRFDCYQNLHVHCITHKLTNQ